MRVDELLLWTFEPAGRAPVPGRAAQVLTLSQGSEVDPGEIAARIADAGLPSSVQSHGYTIDSVRLLRAKASALRIIGMRFDYFGLSVSNPGNQSRAVRIVVLKIQLRTVGVNDLRQPPGGIVGIGRNRTHGVGNAGAQPGKCAVGVVESQGPVGSVGHACNPVLVGAVNNDVEGVAIAVHSRGQIARIIKDL